MVGTYYVQNYTNAYLYFICYMHMWHVCIHVSKYLERGITGQTLVTLPASEDDKWKEIKE